MEIAIPAPSSAFPKLKQLANILRRFGPSKHPLFVFCTPLYQTEVARIFDGLKATIVPSLSGIVRLPPMTENEPFAAIMQHMTRTHWFYLAAGSVPIKADWADQLEQEYLTGGQKYLGCPDYIPHRYRDGSGVDRVTDGAPYILEAAIYPANLASISKYSPISRIVHHEVARRSEMAPVTYLSNLIGNAKWDGGFRYVHVGRAVVVTRVLGDELGDEVLGLCVPDKPAPEDLEPEGILPPAPAPPEIMKKPTMRIFTSMGEMKASQKEEVEVKMPKRPPGRPRKS
jgi:hypothetical protein